LGVEKGDPADFDGRPALGGMGSAVAVGVSAMETGRTSDAAMTRVVSLLFHDVYEVRPSESGFLGLAADRYKLSVSEFDSQLAGLARQRTDRPLVVTESPLDGSPVPFAITVDDGGVSYY